MKILGLETSCDETSAAIIEAKPGDQKVTLLSNIIASSLPLHAKTGGIIPEIAARQQIKYIIPVIEKAFQEANLSYSDIDTIAVTYGPGLIGSLLVGVETAKTLAYLWNKPLVPVNHLIGHIYANWITCHPELVEPERNLALEMVSGSRSKQNVIADQVRNDIIEFPALALIVSGGHTDLVLIKKHGNIQWLGGTRDDAAGEAFDKIGRLLNLPYPGGPEIEKAAKQGNPKAFNFPRPLIGSNDFDFSFSGLKTAVFREIQKIKNINNQITADIAIGVQNAIIDVLIKKTLKAAQKYNVRSIMLAGGVASNQTLRNRFESSIMSHQSSIKFFVPAKNLCTDNAAMIASAGFFNYKEISWQKLTANPELYFD